MRELEVFVNDPFDPSELKNLFINREDLKMASPLSQYPFSENEWSEIFARDPENISLLFYLEEKLVGHTALLPQMEDLYLCYVITHPDFRSQGHSKQMITLSEEFCRLNYSHRVLHLNVESVNEKAIRLYQGMGYEVYKVESTNLKMKKQL